MAVFVKCVNSECVRVYVCVRVRVYVCVRVNVKCVYACVSVVVVVGRCMCVCVYVCVGA